MDDAHERWFQRTWSERRDVLEAALGPMEPMVVSLRWPDRIVPGACVATFRPQEGPGAREDHLWLSVGLSQPPDEESVAARRAAKDSRSGRGYEFGVLVRAPDPRVPELIYELVTYFTEEGAAGPGPGDRVEFGLYSESGGLHPLVGRVADAAPVGATRALLLFPLVQRPYVLTTTGKTLLLMATAITADEWDLAKQTSSEHLLALLVQAGIGQRTDFERGSVTDDPIAMKEWRGRFGTLSREAVGGSLFPLAWWG
jgi:hypothetical protein